MEFLSSFLGKLTCKRRKFFKIFMFGLEGSGKTSVLYKWKSGDEEIPQPTHGFNVESIERGHVTLVIWDLGKRTLMMSVRELWRRYFSMPQLQYRGLIFVVDSSDVERLSEAKEELEGVLQETDSNSLLLVLANKQDKPDALPIQEICESLDLNQCKITWHLQGTCAASGDGLKEALDWLYNKLKSSKNIPK